MDDFEERTGVILTRINELAAFSDDQAMLTRIFGSPAFVDASKKVRSWMEEAGLEAAIDNIGNIRGRLLSGNKNAQTFIIASHIDTVVNAGKFDGPLGVLMGLDIVSKLACSKEKVPFNIELIAFSDEEGVRFHSTFLGSNVVAGRFDKQLLNKTDSSGVSVADVIKNLGGELVKLDGDAIDPRSAMGYFEIHIEQGPVLYEKNLPAAIVTGIAGQNRIELHFKGFAGHAGTVPMDMRSDALSAAAECILEIEKFALAQKETLVATVGKLNIPNSASNVIPGDVVCSLDIRSDNEPILMEAAGQIQLTCQAVCRKRNIGLEWRQVQYTKPVACDNHLNGLLSEAIEEAGYTTVKLVSGAGHDAVAISAIAPVCMLFVRCFKGISHNPLENAEASDIKAALRIAETFIHKLISNHNKV